MRRFNFRFEKILRLRENREQQAQFELGKAVGVLSSIEEQILDVAAKKVAAGQNRFAGGMSFNEMRMFDLYALRLDQTKDALLQEAAKAELEVEKMRALYLDASRDRKVMSKLKERQEQAYRRAVNLEEIKTIDDISSSAFIRKNLAG